MLILVLLGLTFNVRNFYTGKKMVVEVEKKHVFILRTTMYGLYCYEYPSLELKWIVSGVTIPRSSPLIWNNRYLPVLSIRGDRLYKIDVLKGNKIDSINVDFKDYNFIQLSKGPNSWDINFATVPNQKPPFTVIGRLNSKKLNSVITRIGCLIQSPEYSRGRYFAVCASGLSFKIPAKEMLSDFHTGVIEVGLTGKILNRYMLEFQYYAYSEPVYLTREDTLVYIISNFSYLNLPKYRYSVVYKFNKNHFRPVQKVVFKNINLKYPVGVTRNRSIYIILVDNLKQDLYVLDKNLKIIERHSLPLKDSWENSKIFKTYGYYLLSDSDTLVYILSWSIIRPKDPHGGYVGKSEGIIHLFSFKFPFKTPPVEVLKFRFSKPLAATVTPDGKEMIVISRPSDKIVTIKLK